jgi:hypothetical protein
MNWTWAVFTSTGKRRNRARIREQYLTGELWYAGSKVHSLRGLHGFRVLEDWAARWNRANFQTALPDERPRCFADYCPRTRRRWAGKP